MAHAPSTPITSAWNGGFPSPAASSPPHRLEPGDRLDRRTFHQRYEAMPPGFRAELIQGTVIVPSPTLPEHGYVHAMIINWLATYAAGTPGAATHDNVTVFLNPTTEVQPDGLLLIRPEFGGQIRLEDRYFAGAPELVAEVAYSSEAYDLHSKRQAYEEAGVLEYVVLLLRERRIAWFVLRDGKFRDYNATDGVFQSTTFPGLWLDEAALLQGDITGVLSTLQRGLSHEDHKAFIERLARQRPMRQ